VQSSLLGADCDDFWWLGVSSPLLARWVHGIEWMTRCGRRLGRRQRCRPFELPTKLLDDASALFGADHERLSGGLVQTLDLSGHPEVRLTVVRELRHQEPESEFVKRVAPIHIHLVTRWENNLLLRSEEPFWACPLGQDDITPVHHPPYNERDVLDFHPVRCNGSGVGQGEKFFWFLRFCMNRYNIPCHPLVKRRR